MIWYADAHVCGYYMRIHMCTAKSAVHMIWHCGLCMEVRPCMTCIGRGCIGRGCRGCTARVASMWFSAIAHDSCGRVRIPKRCRMPGSSQPCAGSSTCITVFCYGDMCDIHLHRITVFYYGDMCDTEPVASGDRVRPVRLLRVWMSQGFTQADS